LAIRGATFHSGLRPETAKQLGEDADPFRSEEVEDDFSVDEGDLDAMRGGDIAKRNFQLFYQSSILTECIR
jgi:hypothetical protein